MELNEEQVLMRQAFQLLQAQIKDIHDAVVSSENLVLPLKEWKSGVEVKLVIIEYCVFECSKFNSVIHQQREYLKSALQATRSYADRQEVFNNVFDGDFLGKEVGKARKMRAVIVFGGMYFN